MSVVIIGYSGHAFVVCDILKSQKINIKGYCEQEEKHFNPYRLSYLGEENSKEGLAHLQSEDYFIGIGNNKIRQRISNQLIPLTNRKPINVIHSNASVSLTVSLGNGIMIGAGCIINACSIIQEGAICNTQSVIEHECRIGAYSHIAPGAVLCGDVTIGENSFVGAGAVIRQGVKIGRNVTIGAGTVVLKDIPSNSKVVGNPQRYI